MSVPTETALRGRARVLLEAMSERARWIYAAPRDAEPAVRDVALAEGLSVEEEDRGAHVTRHASALGAALVTFDSADLDVLFIEATGDAAAPVLAKVLDRSGFYAQSQLLRTALDVHHPEASKALRTLAHMVVAWDADWSDLFLLHLASPDPVARHEACMAVSLAAMVAHDAAPALALLEEAHRRETYPKLEQTLAEAIRTVGAIAGGPIELESSS